LKVEKNKAPAQTAASPVGNKFRENNSGKIIPFDFSCQIENALYTSIGGAMGKERLCVALIVEKNSKYPIGLCPGPTLDAGNVPKNAQS
jgi:hypothetical protein